MNPQLQQILHNITTRLTKLEQAEKQEPVAWMIPEYGDVLPASQADGTGVYNIPLYTAPSRKEWVGLTDEEILQTLGGKTGDQYFFKFVRAIEAKLKEKNT